MNLKTYGKGFLISAFASLAVFLVCGIAGREHAVIFTGMTGLVSADKIAALYILSFICMIFQIVYFPEKLSDSRKTCTLVFLAAGARLALIPFEPSDDIYRYLWEGKLVSLGLDPYLLPPADKSLAAMARDYPWHDMINHPENTAAYPPLMLLVFSIAGRISMTPLFLKLALVLVDTGAVFLMAGVMKERKADLRWVLVYAVNPLIVISFAGQGHFEPFQVFFLTGAILSGYRKKWGLMYLFLGLGIQVKYVAVVVIPFFVTRKNYAWLWALIPGAAFPFAYFFMLSPDQSFRFFDCLLKFGSEYAFNGPLQTVLWKITGDMHKATGYVKLAFFCAMVWGTLRFHPELRRDVHMDPSHGALYAVTMLLLCSPTVHLWYLSWVFPFFLLVRKKSLWMLMAFGWTYYAVFEVQIITGDWRLPAWYMVFGWAPFIAVLLYEAVFHIKGMGLDRGFGGSEALSVIIPVINEGKGIGECTRFCFEDSAVREVIVVDGGSSDGTPEVAARAGAIVARHQRKPENGGGRGGQILAGLKLAKGDVVAVVHGDTRPEPGMFSKILSVLKANPDIFSGAWGSRFTDEGTVFRILDLANHLRGGFWGIAFGDQVQFFRREPMVSNRLYPDIPLMEDVELNLRNGLLGGYVYFFGKAKVSPRRWKKKGGVNALQIVLRLSLFLARRSFGMPDTVSLYNDYYGNKKG